MTFEEWRDKINVDGYEDLEKLLFDAWFEGHNQAWDKAFKAGYDAGFDSGKEYMKEKISEL